MDDVIQNKVATIEKCLKRIAEEREKDWINNYTYQDALLLNLERACQATIDIASHVVRKKKIGLPKVTREIFDLMHQAGYLSPELSDKMKKMVGFRNLAVHDYGRLSLDVLKSVLENELVHFNHFCKAMISVEL